MTRELIYKYFNEECTDEEYVLVNEYLQGDDLRLLHEYMDEVALNTAEETSIAEAESLQLLEKIHSNIATETIIKHIGQKVDFEENTIKKKTSWSVALRVAASITLIFAVGGGIYKAWKGQENIIAHKALVAWKTIDNRSGNVKQLTMPDGTIIWLNARSSISYKPNQYNIKERETRIIGEAFFDVSHNPKKPFIVRSGSISTKVLGTAFNVEAYKNEKDIRIILVRGKVHVQAEKAARILIPGQLLKYSRTDHKMAIKNIDTKDVNAWISGKLVFNDVPLEDVFRKIEQQYNISIVLSANCRTENKRLSGTFERKTVEDMLNKILFIYGLTFDKKGGAYIINP